MPLNVVDVKSTQRNAFYMARTQDIRNLFKPNGSANASSGMLLFYWAPNKTNIIHIYK